MSIIEKMFCHTWFQMKIKIKNFFFILTNLIILISVFELLLRILTPFPLNDASNTVKDDNLSYKMKAASSKEIDYMGFRNIKGKFKGYDIAAIGDSHTYGWNDLPKNSWPQIIEKKTNRKVYNFGIGSYNIYQFFYLSVENIKKEKSIIFQIGPSQDFVNYHKFSNNSNFWVKYNDILDLDIFSNVLNKDKNNSLNKFQKLKKFLRNNLAFISAFDHYFWNLFLKKKNFTNINTINLGNELGLVKKNRVDFISHNTNLNNPHILKNIENFEKFLIYFNKNSKKKQIMFSIFPTRERIFYEYLVDNKKDFSLYFKETVKKEIEFENFIIDLIIKYDFDVVNATPYILEEFKKSENKKHFYPDEDHPNSLGYEMMANSILDNKSFFEN